MLSSVLSIGTLQMCEIGYAGTVLVFLDGIWKTKVHLQKSYKILCGKKAFFKIHVRDVLVRV